MRRGEKAAGNEERALASPAPCRSILNVFYEFMAAQNYMRIVKCQLMSAVTSAKSEQFYDECIKHLRSVKLMCMTT